MCGDGLADPGECEDANELNLDGCSSGCVAEALDWIDRTETETATSVAGRSGAAMAYDANPVSYTHLTLPTILRV